MEQPANACAILCNFEHSLLQLTEMVSHGKAGREVRLFAGAVIFPSQSIPANLKHFEEHSGSVPQWTDASAFTVGPFHRNFDDLDPQFPGYIKELGIETPALNLLQRKNCP